MSARPHLAVPGARRGAPAGGWLYARSRKLPGSLGALVLIALGVRWADQHLDVRVALALFAPLAAASVVGTSLYVYADGLDRTAARAWWPRRLAHVTLLSAVAVLLLAVAVHGPAQEYGTAVLARNTLGTAGVATLSAVLLGARLSWLPPLVWLCGVHLVARSDGGRVWGAVSWPVSHAERGGAWVAAVVLFLLGAVVHARWGVRARET
ncbi:hypothetical protein ACFWIA_06790 [Streptomyces sp. NPDC127068]|uniref:hypothetical protein n=1 Tax=Streptomyces sp. NPDC127068 TaxID=3347127 RepID=UPI0036583EE1